MKSFPELLVLLDFQKLHHLEKGWRQRIVALLFAIYIHLIRVELKILLQIHEPIADQNAHIVITQQNHVSDFMRGVLSTLPGSINELFVDLERSVLYLLFGLLSLN